MLQGCKAAMVTSLSISKQTVLEGTVRVGVRSRSRVMVKVTVRQRVHTVAMKINAEPQRLSCSTRVSCGRGAELELGGCLLVCVSAAQEGEAHN